MDQDTTIRIIAALNNDQEALKTLNELNEAAKKYNVSEKEYEAARELIIMASIRNNKEAMDIMAESVWNQLNN